MPLRQRVDKGPETHTLYDTPHGDLPTLPGRRFHVTVGALTNVAHSSRRRRIASTAPLSTGSLRPIPSPYSFGWHPRIYTRGGRTLRARAKLRAFEGTVKCVSARNSCWPASVNSSGPGTSTSSR